MQATTHNGHRTHNVLCRAGRASQNQRDGLKAVVSDAVLPLIPAVLEEEDPMPLYALKLLVVLLDTHPTWALHLQRYAPIFKGYSTSLKGIPTWAPHLQRGAPNSQGYGTK